jgi:dihydrofolate reductase
MVTIIAALSPEGVIGKDGTLPWRYPADLKRFKRLTSGHTVVMGRRTWDSLPRRPLPDRRNIVLSRTPRPLGEAGADWFGDLAQALDTCQGEVFVIGGAAIYRAALPVATCLDLTYVPDHVDLTPDVVVFPEINLSVWRPGPLVVHEDDPRLQRREFVRR